MNESLPPVADPLGCVPLLRDVLTASEWDAARAGDRELACQLTGDLALALGRCRLFGVEPPADLDGTLTLEQTLCAAGEWTLRLKEGVEAARRLGADWDACEDPREAEHLGVGLLELNMDAWASFLAIDEGYQSALARDESAYAVLGPALRRLRGEMARLDAALKEEAPLLLACAAETELLANWRANLAEPYRLVLPWWLDERREGTAPPALPEGLAASTRLPEPAFGIPVPPIQELAMAAQGRTPRPQLGAMWRWRSPTREYTASLTLQTFYRSPGDPVVLSFFTPDGDRARTLDGLRVRLGSLPGEIKDGQVRFRAGDLPAGVLAGTLKVGPADRALTPWPLLHQGDTTP